MPTFYKTFTLSVWHAALQTAQIFAKKYCRCRVSTSNRYKMTSVVNRLGYDSCSAHKRTQLSSFPSCFLHLYVSAGTRCSLNFSHLLSFVSFMIQLSVQDLAPVPPVHICFIQSTGKMPAFLWACISTYPVLSITNLSSVLKALPGDAISNTLIYWFPAWTETAALHGNYIYNLTCAQWQWEHITCLHL